MYQSKYYTCDEIDERLIKGYYDDTVSKGYPGTLDQFKLELASQDAVNLDILNNYAGYTSSEAISKINELYPTISRPLTFVFLDKTYNRERRFKYKGVGASSSRRNYSDNSNYIFTLDELNGAEGATDIKALLFEISTIGFSGSAIVIDGNLDYYCGQLTIFCDNMGHVVNQVLLTNNTLSDDGTTITSSHMHTRTFQYERFLVVSGDSWVDREGNPVGRLAYSKWYTSDYYLQDLQEGVTENTEKLSELEPRVNSVSGLTLSKGDLVTGIFFRGNDIGTKVSEGSNNDASSILVGIKGIDKIFIKSVGNEVAPPLMFLNEDRIIIYKSDSWIDGTINIPSNAYYAAINLYPNTADFLFIIDSKIKQLTNDVVKFNELTPMCNTTSTVNLLVGKTSRKGFYDTEGYFNSHPEFDAYEEIPVVEKSRYVYTGELFSPMALLIYDKFNNIIETITNNNEERFIRVEKDNNGHIIFADFLTPENASYIKVSGRVGKYSIGFILIEQNKGIPKELATLNLVDSSELVRGKLSQDGQLIDDENFFTSAFIRVKDNTEYIYTGGLNNDSCLIFFDELERQVGFYTDGHKSENIDVIKEYKIKGLTTVVKFITPQTCTKIRICGHKYVYELGLYENGLNINFTLLNAKLNHSILLNHVAITKEEFTPYVFWDARGEILKLSNNAEGQVFLSEIREGESLYIKSVGNEVAPPLIFADMEFNIIYRSNSTVDGTFIAPKNSYYVAINRFPRGEVTVEIPQSQPTYDEPTWSIPKKIYAIKGQEKSLYLDNVVNRNEDAPWYVVEASKSFGYVDSRRFFFTPDTIGTKSIYLSAWDCNNQRISSQNVTFEVIDNVLTTSKVVLCIGDSITEGKNMPYYIQEGLKNALTGSSIQPTFVGTKGGTSGMGNKPTKHEGWYGRTYQWLAGDDIDETPSPFVNPTTNRLDISYYRTTKLGITQKIDVVNLAMGFNNTNTKENADAAFTSMQKIISAFKEDNPSTKFIVHLVTFPALGNVLQVDWEEKIDKKNSLQYFRNLCLDAYNNNEDPNIFVGDFGLGYDRWYAYQRSKVSPSSYYPNDEIEVITDRVHPSENGTRQMGENMMHSILKALQM